MLKESVFYILGNMNKKLFFSVFVFVLSAVCIGGLVMAEEGSMVKENRDAVRKEIKTTRDAVKTEIKDTRNTVRAEIKDNREQMKLKVESAKKDLEAKREEMKLQREEFNERLKEKRQALQEQIKEKKETLKERLKIVKDERKKQTVEKLDQRMDALNEKMTSHFSEALKKIDDLLVRIGERANRAEENGIDVSAVRSAITSVSTSIEASRAAIAVQAGKTYTITITSETGLRQDVGVIRQQLNQDLRAVQTTVKAAHENARKAATALAQLPKPTLTSSPTPSPSPEVETEEVE